MACRYAGIDWASDKHDVLVADETGVEVVAATFAHDEKGLTALCRTLVRLDVALVAVKRPDGLLVERLLDAGLRVFVQTGGVLDVEGRRVSFQPGKSRGRDGMSGVLLIPMAVATGVVVIVVAVAVVLVVLFVTVSMRGGQRRGAKRRGETRQELADAHERAERPERDRDIAQEQTRQRIDPDR
jgi:uncharacterized membrane protein